MSVGTAKVIRELGNYDLLEKIAEGGMGAVYKGRHRATGHVVAIKVVPQETARNGLLLKRFEQEFKAASLIDHPNVVKAIEYCGSVSSPFLVMEFVDGESLGDKVEREGRLSEELAVHLIAQVCEGLHRAHKQGLIHRDVKPDNILITRDNVAKLTDLGLVKDIEAELNLTKTGKGLGTPHYMSPEQFRNAKNADVRCDVYSLGATLYMLVTGHVPFDNTSPLDCWLKKTKNDLPSPKTLCPQLTDRVDFAIRRAMAPGAADRPASCREFMEDLTGLPWKAGQSSAASTDSAHAPIESSAIWYMVYYGPDSKPKTVKGTTEIIRANAMAGALGDLTTTLVSRSKAGPFAPFRKVAEFRDLVLSSSDSLGGSSTCRLSNTQFTAPDQPADMQDTPGPVRGQPRPNAETCETPSSVSMRTPITGGPSLGAHLESRTRAPSSPARASLLDQLPTTPSRFGRNAEGASNGQVDPLTTAALAVNESVNLDTAKRSALKAQQSERMPFVEKKRLAIPEWLPFAIVVITIAIVIGVVTALKM